MDLKNLWVGERVRLKNSGREGRFEGINQEGKARIRVGTSIVLSKGSNLEIIPEKELFPDIDAYLEAEAAAKQNALVQQQRSKINIECALDLHIEKLAPQMKNEASGRIIEYQLKESEAFIRKAISAGNPHITIIHGKGQGVLKEAIEQQLKFFPQVKFTFSKNGGGAVEVWL